jgi:hypothetical protein
VEFYTVIVASLARHAHRPVGKAASLPVKMDKLEIMAKKNVRFEAVKFRDRSIQAAW